MTYFLSTCQQLLYFHHRNVLAGFAVAIAVKHWSACQNDIIGQLRSSYLGLWWNKLFRLQIFRLLRLR